MLLIVWTFLLPVTFVSANELIIIEPPETGMSSMSGVVGGEEIYYNATFMKSTSVAKYDRLSAMQLQKSKYVKKTKQLRFAGVAR